MRARIARELFYLALRVHGPETVANARLLLWVHK